MEVSAASNAARASDVTAVKSFCAEAEEGDAAFAAEERVTTTDGALLGLAFGSSDANATARPVFLETALSESVVDPAALLRSDATALVTDELAAAIVLMVRSSLILMRRIRSSPAIAVSLRLIRATLATT
jgi:hypothetical protein